MTDRCHRCDRPIATQKDWDTIPEGDGEHLCWDSTRCEPVDWRARALVAEAALRATQKPKPPNPG